MAQLAAEISEPEYVLDSAVTVSPGAMMELPVVASEWSAKLDTLLNNSVWVLTSHSVSQTAAPSAASLQVTQVSAEVAPTTALAESAAQSTHGR